MKSSVGFGKSGKGAPAFGGASGVCLKCVVYARKTIETCLFDVSILLILTCKYCGFVWYYHKKRSYVN